MLWGSEAVFMTEVLLVLARVRPSMLAALCQIPFRRAAHFNSKHCDTPSKHVAKLMSMCRIHCFTWNTGKVVSYHQLPSFCCPLMANADSDGSGEW